MIAPLASEKVQSNVEIANFLEAILWMLNMNRFTPSSS